VDLVDEQHVPLAQVGEDGRQVAGAFDGRARGDLDVHPHFVGDDVSQSRLAQPWRAVHQHVVQSLVAGLGGGDQNLHVLLDRRLADVFVPTTRAQTEIQSFLFRLQIG